MATILVSGKDGQLGQEIAEIAPEYSQWNFVFCDRSEMDITNPAALENAFEKYKPDYFINTAAYTAVDKAELDKDAAFSVNATAVGEIAKLCKRYGAKLIHISTDYVFNGASKSLYAETDEADPVNYYGYSKLKGEELALSNNADTIIIRTSWVYGIYRNNFVKTMLRLMKDRSEINVVKDQVGSPTNAKDLAEVILFIINNDLESKVAFHPGIYHFSNSGIISWYEFAQKIAELKSLSCKVQPIDSIDFPTTANRPKFSVLNKEKIKAIYHINLKEWDKSLQTCLDRL